MEAAQTKLDSTQSDRIRAQQTAIIEELDAQVLKLERQQTKLTTAITAYDDSQKESGDKEYNDAIALLSGKQ
jgi:hypothetical protein